MESEADVAYLDAELGRREYDSHAGCRQKKGVPVAVAAAERQTQRFCSGY